MGCLERIFCQLGMSRVDFLSALGMFSLAIIISYTSSSRGGSIFATARSVQRGFFYKPFKYFRSPAKRFLCNNNNFLYEFKWRWFNLCCGTQRQTRICCRPCNIFSLTSWTFFSGTIIISYTTSIGACLIFDTKRSARR